MGEPDLAISKRPARYPLAMAPLSRQELFVLLEERIRDPLLAQEQEKRIWESNGVEAAIMVVDLAGFSRLTRRHGILHFLTIYRRACLLAAPIIAAAGGRIVKCEADNIVATFPQPRAALAAARGLVAETAALDLALPVDQRIFVCIGIGFGRFLELRDDIYGDEVNIAFKLGEDVARGREILLTEGARARLANDGETDSTEERTIELGGAPVRYFQITT